VDAAGVAHHLDAARRDVGEHRAHRDVDEVGRVVELGAPEARRGEDRHRRFGEVVEDQVVDRPRGDQLRRGDAAVAPEAGTAADANDPVVALAVAVPFALAFALVIDSSFALRSPTA
jgi:hypothetical protein